MKHKIKSKLVKKILEEQRSKPKSLFSNKDRIVFNETISDKKKEEIIIHNERMIEKRDIVIERTGLVGIHF